VLGTLAAQVQLKGKRVASQEYGVSNHELTAGLEARGARVTIVPVYRWTLPADRAPLRAALNTIAAGSADVAIFTSSNQVTNVIQLAEAEGIGDSVKRGFARMAIGSIGPVCSEQIRAYGLSVDFEPEHSKLGHLVKEAIGGLGHRSSPKQGRHASPPQDGDLGAVAQADERLSPGRKALKFEVLKSRHLVTAVFPCNRICKRQISVTHRQEKAATPRPIKEGQ